MFSPGHFQPVKCENKYHLFCSHLPCDSYLSPMCLLLIISFSSSLHCFFLSLSLQLLDWVLGRISLYLFIFFKFYFIFKLYITVLDLPNIKMNPPQVGSSIIAWRNPWTGESGGLQSVASQRVGHDWACTHQEHNKHWVLVVGHTGPTLLQMQDLWLQPVGSGSLTGIKPSPPELGAWKRSPS